MKKIVLILLFLLVMGCTTAGPFVTNISFDGKDTLIIERCMAQYNGFTGTITTVDCHSMQIKICPEPKLIRPRPQKESHL